MNPNEREDVKTSCFAGESHFEFPTYNMVKEAVQELHAYYEPTITSQPAPF